jgi:uncharacterized membrane protein
MSTLSVWKFDTCRGAGDAAQTLGDLPAAMRESVHDAAQVYWVSGRNQPTTRLVGDLASEEGLGADFFGLLFGFIFFSPLLGAAVGSAGGGMCGSLAEVGIDEVFVNRVRDDVNPGTSALFVLGSDAAIDELRDALWATPPVEVLVTRLSRRHVGALRQVFVG